MSDIVADIPPVRLYKYRGLDRNREGGVPYERDRSIIVGCSLWAGSPLDFNDPFDCYPVLDLEGTPEEKQAWAARIAPDFGMAVEQAVNIVDAALNNPIVRAQMLDWHTKVNAIGVVSLTEEPNDMLMWAHYSDSHRGYCLELDATLQPLSLAWRVHYAKQRPTFRLFDPNRDDFIQRSLLHKADFWAHEREWRIVRPVDMGAVNFPSDALRSIIFGASIAQEDEAALRAINAERETPLVFKRAKLDERNYRVDIIDA